eukprot:899749_1
MTHFQVIQWLSFAIIVANSVWVDYNPSDGEVESWNGEFFFVVYPDNDDGPMVQSPKTRIETSTTHPTRITTQNPTNTPTKRPTKQPTPRPTRKPTSKPTSKPTMPLTEPWDKVASPLSTKQNKRHNVESSNDDKLLKDAQRKARALTANAPQAKARGANTINLYDYAFKYHGVTRPEMEAALAQYQDTLIDDPENKAVIIKQYTCSNKHDLSHVSSFMTCIDVTLEELHQFAALIIEVGPNTAICGKVFSKTFSTFITMLRTLHNRDHLYGSVVERIRSVLDLFFLKLSRKQTLAKEVINFMQYMGCDKFFDLDSDLTITFTLSTLSSNLGKIAIRFLLISYQELLASKVLETSELLTVTKYAIDNKIPNKFKAKFELLQRQYYDVISRMNITTCRDDEMTKELDVLMRYHTDLSLFAFDLQLASDIYACIFNKRSFGTIAVSAGIVAKSTDIDKLLMVLGYSENSIFRYRVDIAKHSVTGFRFYVTPIKLGLVTKFNETLPEMSKKHRKKRPVRKSENGTQHSNANVSTKHVRLIAIPEDVRETMPEMVGKMCAKVLNDPNYAAVIVQDEGAMNTYSFTSTTMGTTPRVFVVYDIIDSTFDAVLNTIINFMNDILQLSKTGDGVKSIIYLLGDVISVCGKLDNSLILDKVFASVAHRNDSKSQDIHVASELFHVFKKTGQIQKADFDKYIPDGMDMMDIAFDSLVLVELAFLEIQALRIKSVQSIIGRSAWSRDEKMPNSLFGVFKQLQSLVFSKIWTSCIHKYVGMMDDINGAYVKKFKSDLVDMRDEFKHLIVISRIGNIIYNWYRHGARVLIGIVVDENVITPLLYDVFCSLGYTEKSILITTPDITNATDLNS